MRRSGTSVVLSVIVVIIGITVRMYRTGHRAPANPPVAYSTDQDGNDRAAPAAQFAPLYEVPAFKLLDQDGQPFTDRDLTGRVWIIDFVFTNCAGPCPLMTSKMAELQKKIPRAGVGFISVTVDPKRDTPAVLKKYAKDFSADEARWKFLTGTSDQIDAFARDMKIAAAKESDESVTHSTYFLLIDQTGRVVKIHRLSDDNLVKQLVADANALAGN